MTISCILFDLGNVLLLHNGRRRLRALAKACAQSEDAVEDFLRHNDIIDQLDLGHANADDLAATLSAFANKHFTAEQAVKLWATAFEPNLPLWHDLDRLAGQRILGIFSNNPPFIRSFFPLQVRFKYVFLSSQIGAMKPDLAAFNAVQSALRWPPTEILFIDDKAENIARAKTIGWNAIQFKNNDQLEQELIHLKLW
jgi:HAD superfamily hydrolase (TIGR01509 family)